MLEKITGRRPPSHPVQELLLIITLICLAHASLLWLIYSILNIRKAGAMVGASIALMTGIFVLIGFSTFGIDLKDGYTLKNMFCFSIAGAITPFILLWLKNKF